MYSQCFNCFTDICIIKEPKWLAHASSAIDSSCLGNRNGFELEPGRCRRTNGKKWRCNRGVVPDRKYCTPTHAQMPKCVPQPPKQSPFQLLPLRPAVELHHIGLTYTRKLILHSPTRIFPSQSKSAPPFLEAFRRKKQRKERITDRRREGCRLGLGPADVV
ncbi:Growth-regulating factor 12 [Morella rubra]|uniref:Growth-regulating factor n=1 Tax=Morella rubra TaxID=262757 RepID=A0A6A1VTN7_9ROSI|nr:Growth-regulating factor 12 [Morella rubra]